MFIFCDKQMRVFMRKKTFRTTVQMERSESWNGDDETKKKATKQSKITDHFKY